MQEDHTNISADFPSPEGGAPVPNGSEPFRTVPHTSEPLGSAPHRSDPFRTVPNSSESFRTLRNRVERNAAHTLTVKEVARMFETAGVSRTERSIVKWCLPNKHDVARLDAFFDSNERKWFITQESVEQAISEEKARAARRNEPVRNDSEPIDPVPNGSDARGRQPQHDAGETPERIKELETQMLDLKILNGGKDFLIDQLRKERESLLNKVVDYSRQVGQLETSLRQLASPRNSSEQNFLSDSHDPGQQHG